MINIRKNPDGTTTTRHFGTGKNQQELMTRLLKWEATDKYKEAYMISIERAYDKYGEYAATKKGSQLRSLCIEQAHKEGIANAQGALYGLI